MPTLRAAKDDDQLFAVFVANDEELRGPRLVLVQSPECAVVAPLNGCMQDCRVVRKAAQVGVDGSVELLVVGGFEQRGRRGSQEHSKLWSSKETTPTQIRFICVLLSFRMETHAVGRSGKATKPLELSLVHCESFILHVHLLQQTLLPNESLSGDALDDGELQRAQHELHFGERPGGRVGTSGPLCARSVEGGANVVAELCAASKGAKDDQEAGGREGETGQGHSETVAEVVEQERCKACKVLQSSLERTIVSQRA